MAEASRHRILRLSRRANQQRGAERLPILRGGPMAAQPSTAQPEGSHHVATGSETGRRLAATTESPSPLAAETVRRQAPEVGAVCGNPARTELCGGRSVTGV